MTMRNVFNVLWLIICGWFFALLWAVFGLLWSITVIGLPVGLQCFKCARLMLWPFGYDFVLQPDPFKFIVNVLWLLIGGLEICLAQLAVGAICCVTIVGIPLGLQCFKLAKLALMPLGARLERK